MADFRLSTRAAADLGGVARYTIATFGVEQARRYRDDLEACFRTPARIHDWAKARNDFDPAFDASSIARTPCSTCRMRTES